MKTSKLLPILTIALFFGVTNAIGQTCNPITIENNDQGTTNCDCDLFAQPVCSNGATPVYLSLAPGDVQTLNATNYGCTSWASVNYGVDCGTGSNCETDCSTGPSRNITCGTIGLSYTCCESFTVDFDCSTCTFSITD